MSTRVTISESYRNFLQYLSDPVELCIENGRVVAVFGGEPTPDKRPEWMGAPPTREEFEQMKAGPWISSEDLLAKLRSMS